MLLLLQLSSYVMELLQKESESYGKEFGLRLFGLRALNSLRLEKNYGSWAREYRPIYGPLEAELGRFVAHDKEADFIGKRAVIQEKSRLDRPVNDSNDTFPVE